MSENRHRKTVTQFLYRSAENLNTFHDVKKKTPKNHQDLKFKLAFRGYNNLETLAGKGALTEGYCYCYYSFSSKARDSCAGVYPNYFIGRCYYVFFLNF